MFWVVSGLETLVKPFHVLGFFLYPPENIRKPHLFLYFQGVKKDPYHEIDQDEK